MWLRRAEDTSQEDVMDGKSVRAWSCTRELSLEQVLSLSSTQARLRLSEEKQVSKEHSCVNLNLIFRQVTPRLTLVHYFADASCFLSAFCSASLICLRIVRYKVNTRYTSVTFCILSVSICSRINVTVFCFIAFTWFCNTPNFCVASFNSLWRRSFSNKRASLHCNLQIKELFQHTNPWACNN